jgi:hypothetical protein
MLLTTSSFLVAGIIAAIIVSAGIIANEKKETRYESMLV